MWKMSTRVCIYKYIQIEKTPFFLLHNNNSINDFPFFFPHLWIQKNHSQTNLTLLQIQFPLFFLKKGILIFFQITQDSYSKKSSSSSWLNVQRSTDFLSLQLPIWKWKMRLLTPKTNRIVSVIFIQNGLSFQFFFLLSPAGIFL